MVVDSASTDTGRVNGDLPHAESSSMLLAFLHDTSSFSDRQVLIANADITNVPTPAQGHELTPSRPNTDTTGYTDGKKNGKPVGK